MLKKQVPFMFRILPSAKGSKRLVYRKENFYRVHSFDDIGPKIVRYCMVFPHEYT